MSLFRSKAFPVTVAPTDYDYGVQTYAKVRAWSYSLVQQHAKCPLSVRYARIDRLPQPDNEGQSRGITAHKQVAEYLKSGVWVESMIPHPTWQSYFDTVRPFVPLVEQQIAFNKDWALRGWWDADVWGRAIVDAAHREANKVKTTAVIHEWKTGKAWPEHYAQMRLYALMGLLMFPEADEVRVVIGYLDQSTTSREARSIGMFNRRLLGSLKEEFAHFADALLNDDVYPARPNRFCGWCHFRKSNGGPCEHG